MLRLPFLSNNNLNKKTDLLSVRLWFFSGVMVYMSVLAVKLLTIDWSKCELPEIRHYNETQYKLITAWFNLLMMVYYPVSMYCDLREKKAQAHLGHVVVLNSLRHLMFTSILLPTTLYADILFWRLYNKDSSLLIPQGVDDYLPADAQHGLHTLTAVAVLFDLLAVPRRKPASLKVHVAVMLAWVTAYEFVVFDNWRQDVFVYPMLRKFGGTKLVLFGLMTYIEHFTYFLMQWPVMDLLSFSRRKDISRPGSPISIEN